MGCERGGQRFPLAHEPRHLLLGTLALVRCGANALAVRIEGRIAQPRADLGELRLERVNLPLTSPSLLRSSRISLVAGPAFDARARSGRTAADAAGGGWRGPEPVVSLRFRTVPLVPRGVPPGAARAAARAFASR